MNFIALDSDPWAEQAREGDINKLPSVRTTEAEKRLRHAQEQQTLTQQYPGRRP
jgi:hypothetical protein